MPEIRRHIAAFLVLLGLAPALSGCLGDPTVKEMERSVVRVLIFKNGELVGTGSGFVLNSDGNVITNQHVAVSEQGITLWVRASGTLERLRADIVASDAVLDLAILKIRGKLDRPPVVLANMIPPRGAAVTAIGYPGLSDASAGQAATQATATTGTVSLIQEQRRNLRRLVVQHDNEILHGNSGGPLFDSCGRVLGVTSGGFRGSDGDTNYISIHVREVVKFAAPFNVNLRSSTKSCHIFVMAPYYWTAGVASILLLIYIILAKPFGKSPSTLSDMLQRTGLRAFGSSVSRGEPSRGGGETGQSADKRKVVMVGLDRDGSALRLELLFASMAEAPLGLIIGRDAEFSDIAISDKSLSAIHARISLAGDQVFIEDLNSTNKTTLNGAVVEPYKKVEFTHGAKIRLGGVDFEVLIGT